MSKLAKFFQKLLGQGAANQAAGELIGGAALGLGAALNITNLGGYQNPNIIDGYSYNPADGNWYKPSPFTGEFDFASPASPEQRAILEQQKRWRTLHNEIENVGPSTGNAGDLEPFPVGELLRRLPEIYDRYRELWPDIYRDLRDYFREPFWPEAGAPRDIEQTCRNPNFPRTTPPSYRIVYVDPLAIDLDGDGIETLGINGASTVLFDHDGDRIRTGTGWLGGDDAWLVRDLNGNGQIDSGAEMFGDQTILPDSRKAVSGLHALGALNSNADNKINSADAAFSELRIWQDLNQNGITDAGELKTLAEAGIAEISLGANQHRYSQELSND